MDEALKISVCRLGRVVVLVALIVFPLRQQALAEGVKFEQKLIHSARGESGPAMAVDFTIGDAVYRSRAAPGWKWTTDAMGFDVAAFGPGAGTSVIGVRSERLLDPTGKAIGKMGPLAHAALRKRWDTEAASGGVKVLSWEGSPESEEITVCFRRIEDGRELEGRERAFFGEGRLITVGMLSDARQLGLTEGMFAQFNGSFAKLEP